MNYIENMIIREMKSKETRRRADKAWNSFICEDAIGKLLAAQKKEASNV